MLTPRFSGYCREYLPPGSGLVAVGAISVAFHLPYCTAPRTAPRFIIIASRYKQFLFCSAESEGSPAIGAMNRFVHNSHWIISSLRNSGSSSGHPILNMNLWRFYEAVKTSCLIPLVFSAAEIVNLHSIDIMIIIPVNLLLTTEIWECRPNAQCLWNIQKSLLAEQPYCLRDSKY